MELDLGEVVPSMAGPKRPEGRVALKDIGAEFEKALESEYKKTGDTSKRYQVAKARITISATAML